MWLLQGVYDSRVLLVREGSEHEWLARILSKLATTGIILLLLSLVIWGNARRTNTSSIWVDFVDRDAGFSEGAMSTSWANISRRMMFGYGIGSSGIMSGVRNLYPHNVILQIWLMEGSYLHWPPLPCCFCHITLYAYISCRTAESTRVGFRTCCISFLFLDIKSTNSYTARTCSC